MRNSELMRRRANVSTLDLGRIKSDLEAIREISQEGKNGRFILRLRVSFRVFPPSLEDDLLMHTEPVLYYPYPHIYYP